MMNPKPDVEGVDFWNVRVEQLPKSYAAAAGGIPGYKSTTAELLSVFHGGNHRGTDLYATVKPADGPPMRVGICHEEFGPDAFDAMWSQYFARNPKPNGEQVKFYGMPIMERSWETNETTITTHDVVMQVRFYTTNGADLYLSYTVKDANTGKIIVDFKLQQCKQSTYTPEIKTFEVKEILNVHYNDTFDYEAECIAGMKFCGTFW